MSVEKEMTEKELVLDLIGDDELNLVLKAFNESVGNKKTSFKRMKLKQCLNAVKTKQNRLTPFDFLEEQLAYKKMKGLSLEKTIRLFQNPEAEIPTIVKYFTLRHYHPAFFKENYQIMKENILNQRFFLSNIHAFQNDEELKAYYLEIYDSEDEPRDAYVQLLLNWYESEIGSLDEVCERVKDWTLKDFDFNRSTNGNNTPMMLALLKLKRLDPEIDAMFLHLCINDCLVEQRLLGEKQLAKQTGELKTQIEELEQTIKAQKKEIKAHDQEMKQVIKKYEQERLKEVQSQTDELKELNNRYQQDKNAWEKEAALKESLSQRVKHLEDELQWQQDLTNTYQWALRTHYDELKLAVLHQSDLVYLPTLFPDIQFAKHVNNFVEKESIQTLFVQKYGMTHNQRSQLKLLSPTVSIIELEGQEEREQLMELTHYLNQIKEK